MGPNKHDAVQSIIIIIIIIIIIAALPLATEPASLLNNRGMGDTEPAETVLADV